MFDKLTKSIEDAIFPFEEVVVNGKRYRRATILNLQFLKFKFNVSVNKRLWDVTVYTGE